MDLLFSKNWRWAEFLIHTEKSLVNFDPKACPIPKDFVKRDVNFGSKNKTLNSVIETWTCKTKKTRKIRAACVEASGPISVLNLLFIPSNFYDLPFFGADFVSLPSGHLLALDLQPTLKNDQIHTGFFYERVSTLHSRWQSELPDGGPIPEDAKDYFSPGFLWTKLPLDIESDILIKNIIRPAYSEYLALYLDLMESAQKVSSERASMLLSGQKDYMNYRSKKDPARGMLTRFYGRNWTESYIHNVLFNIND